MNILQARIKRFVACLQAIGIFENDYFTAIARGVPIEELEIDANKGRRLVGEAALLLRDYINDQQLNFAKIAASSRAINSVVEKLSKLMNIPIAGKVRPGDRVLLVDFVLGSSKPVKDRVSDLERRGAEVEILVLLDLEMPEFMDNTASWYLGYSHSRPKAILTLKELLPAGPTGLVA